MHKYWGKKPSRDLMDLIERYSKEGDIVLDPFSGYGVFCSEAYIFNRNVISNDLNPIANFINNQLLNKEIDLELVVKHWKIIKKEFQTFNYNWYKWKVDDNFVELNSILRDKNNIPIKAKFYMEYKYRPIEMELNLKQVEEFIEYENNYFIEDWYPNDLLIQNSRISAKRGMKISDLFTKRTLACHAKLLSLIEQHSHGKEKELLKLAFTSNLANCSKLVPPIKTRGEMAQGAWMTGFYTGDTYIENNVLSYFDNRLNKVIKGKKDYLSNFNKSNQLNLYSMQHTNKYTILNNDAKKLELKNESVDYIFTDPPYGDAVPYFEQSIIWNSWLKFNPDYSNEIVVSDSKERNKKIENFEIEINVAFSEIRRVLKMNKFFSLTYHSLSGIEWKAITNSCISNGFELHDFKWLVQKSFTPRQLNRSTTVKGDVLVTFKKVPIQNSIELNSDKDIKILFIKVIKSWLKQENLDTNEIFLRVMKYIFENKILINNVNLLDILKENFIFNEKQRWENYA